MNRQEFLEKLDKELTRLEVDDAEDIVDEYSEHFDYKLSVGRTEEEIIKKLNSPETIAEKYAASDKKDKAGDITKAILRNMGLGFLNVLMGFVFTVLFCAVLVVAACALACAVFGFCALTAINIGGLMPAQPIAAGVFLGLTLLALCLVLVIGTIYCWLYAMQWVKVYWRWQKNMFARRFLYPAISLHPLINKPLANRIKFSGMVGAFTSIVFFAVWFIVSICLAGQFAFWA